MNAAAREGPEIDILVDAPLWGGVPEAEETVRRALTSACERTGTPPNAALCVLLTDDAAMQDLNRQWRGRDAPTNVLSFPAPPAPAGAAGMLGDIAIAFETVEREAREEGKPFAHHLAHIAVHGFLHLLGFDHENDAEAASMEARERAVLAALGVPDPYAARPSDPAPAR